MSATYLDTNNLQIDRDILDKLYDALMLDSPFPLYNESTDTSANIITADCSLYGMTDLSITVKLNPDSTTALEATLSKTGSSFSISGLTWLPFSAFNMTVKIALDDSVSGNATATSVAIGTTALSLTGILNESDTNYYWSFDTPNLSNINFTELIPLNDAAFTDALDQVTSLGSTTINKLEVVLYRDKYGLIIHTPLSWDITGNLTIAGLAVEIYSASGVSDLEFVVRGTMTANSNSFDISASIVQEDGTYLYAMEMSPVTSTDSLSITDIMDSSNVFTPNSDWSTKLGSGTSLSYIKLSYSTVDSTFTVDASGIFVGVASSLHFTSFMFFDTRFFAFSASFSADKVAITEVLSTQLHIDTSSIAWLPDLKVGIDYIGFNQLDQMFEISGPVEIGSTNPINIDCTFKVEWGGDLIFHLDLGFLFTPLVLSDVINALGLDTSYLEKLVPAGLVEKLLATSFSRLTFKINTTSKEYTFFGAASIFGSWDIESNTRLFDSDGSTYFYFDASAVDPDSIALSLKDLPTLCGFFGASDLNSGLIPDVSVLPQQFSFDQVNKQFSLTADWYFSGKLLSSQISFSSASGSKMGFLLESDANDPLSFLTIFSTLVPKFSVPSSFPLDIFILKVDLTFYSGTENSGLVGNVTGYLTLADVQVDLSAQSVGESGEGWLFSGSSGSGQSIAIGALIDELDGKFSLPYVSTPTLISSLTFSDLATTFNTGTKDFSFSGTADFIVHEDASGNSANDVTASMTTKIVITHLLNGAVEKNFAGTLSLGGASDPKVFDVLLNTSSGSNLMLATYSNAAGDDGFDIGELINSVLSTPAAPTGLTISLHSAFMAYLKDDASTSKLVFSIDIGNGLNLSNLPLVGKMFPKGKTISLSYQIQYASTDFTATEVTTVNSALPNGVHELLTASDGTMAEGLKLAVCMLFAEDVLPLELSLAASGSSADPNAKSYSKNTDGTTNIAGNDPVVHTGNSTDSTKWFNIGKSMGPIHFGRIGVAYSNGALKFALDASFSLGGLVISLNGLSVSSPLTRFDPVFNLEGLGISYSNPALEISGAFIRETITDSEGNTYDEFSGMALLKMNELSISAIGSYAYVNDQPSLFIYAALDYPIGGPSFFFVTGLSLGFGYNRALIMPSIDKVLEFPLVAEAMSGASSAGADKATLSAKMEALHNYLPVATGQMFFVLGIRFTTFNLIESNILVAASFGKRFEMNLLGISTLTVPSEVSAGQTPLAVVQMALKGSFIPDEGFIGLRGQLTSASYILSKDCKLTGGFAFYAWYKGTNAGDFVATIGGYHPDFKKPDHYPSVPRLSINWQLDSHTHIKGSAYFALCAHALMAGGHLEATYENGNLKAWYKAGADFLVSWKPYHYEASIYVNVGGSYTYKLCGTHKITVDIGAKVSIWGPEFGGHATLDLGICSIGMDFGASRQSEPDPIDWNEFESSFLPDSNLCTATASDGLVGKGVVSSNPDVEVEEGEAASSNLGVEVEVINPKNLKIITDAVIPAKTVTFGSEDELLDNTGDANWNTNFGIGPMDESASNVNSALKIEINKIVADSSSDVSADFKYTVRTKKAPAAMWGEKLQPGINDDSFIDNTFAGLEIEVASQPDLGSFVEVSSSAIKYETTTASDVIEWENDLLAFTDTTLDSDQETNEDLKIGVINDSIETNGTRDTLLSALGMDSATIDLTNTVGDDLILAPQVM